MVNYCGLFIYRSAETIVTIVHTRMKRECSVIEMGRIINFIDFID